MQAEVEIRDTGHCDIVVGSLEVHALYPSLDQVEASKIVSEFIMRSKVKLSGVNWREAQVFLSSNMTEDKIKAEGLECMLPRRLWKYGPRPGNTTTELGERRDDPRKDPQANPRPTKWTQVDPDRLSEVEKRHLLSKVIGVAVLTVFRHHMYQFNGTTYRQAGGGPIGLHLTSIVARIVMDNWASSFLNRVSEAGTRVHLFAKYVDNVNLVLGGLSLGTRWSRNSLVHTAEAEEMDRKSGKTVESVTMDCMRAAADSVVPWLTFTSDSSEHHESKTVPILDLQVWIRHPAPEEEDDRLGSDLLAWSFYEKPVASSKLLRAASATNWSLWLWNCTGD